MIVALASPSSASALWYLSRGTGTVALLLLTSVFVLGIMARGNLPLPACPRFVTPAVHRNLSLLAVAVLAVHILTAVADPYAPIRLVDAILPFHSAYRPLWVGLGALAFDILIALVVTSLLRARIGRRAWRAIHWAAYASWPIAVAHGLGTGTDVKATWLLVLTVLCALGVVAAVLWRVLWVASSTPQKKVAATGLAVAVPLALALWVMVGPLAPHWAARAGTPASLLTVTPASTGSTGTISAAPQVTAPVGNATISGQAKVRQSGAVATVVFDAPLSGGPGGRVRITLTGRPDGGEGIALSDGTVRYARHALTYAGQVTALDGGRIAATLSGPTGRLQLVADLTVAASQSFTGTVSLS